MSDCTATKPVTVGSPGPVSAALLVCDLEEGHECLHYDQQDDIWWRSAADEERS